jgi:hypothetical protein
MESDSGVPLYRMLTAELVARTILKIDQSSEVDRDILLANLVGRVWPTRRSQNNSQNN